MVVQRHISRVMLKIPIFSDSIITNFLLILIVTKV